MLMVVGRLMEAPMGHDMESAVLFPDGVCLSLMQMPQAMSHLPMVNVISERSLLIKDNGADQLPCISTCLIWCHNRVPVLGLLDWCLIIIQSSPSLQPSPRSRSSHQPMNHYSTLCPRGDFCSQLEWMNMWKPLFYIPKVCEESPHKGHLQSYKVYHARSSFILHPSSPSPSIPSHWVLLWGHRR